MAAAADAPAARGPEPLASLWRLPASRALGLLSWLVPALVLLAAGLLLAREYRVMRDQQAERQALLARVLEDHATRSLDSVMLALNGLADAAARGVPPDGLRPLMQQSLTALTTLRGVALLDERGHVLAASDAADVGVFVDLVRLGLASAAGPQGRGEVVGRFVAARQLSGLDQHVPQGVGFVPFARPVRLPSGESGWALALLNPDAFANFQQVTLADSASAAALMRLDGEFMAATLESGVEVGMRQPQLPALARVSGGEDFGAWEGDGLSPGVHLAAFRALRQRPLLVVVETEIDEIHDRWWARARSPLLLTLTTALALGLLARAAAASLRSRERAREALDVARQRVEASEQELRAQLGFARSLLASNPLPMAVLDGERRYLDVNPAWEQFTGQRREAVLGQPARHECSAEASALHAQMDAQLMAQGGERHYEAVWRDANGRQRDLFISKASFPGTDGRPGGIVVAFMDISEFREAERTTRAARDAALETSRAKSEFIANVSHELRTPLQSILGFSELGQVRARAQPRVAEMFADVHSAGQRMLALVNDLLDLSKIEHTQEQLHPERQDLRPLLREVAAELQPLLADKQLSLGVRGGDQELVALVDAARLQQVLRNLLANAIKFSPSGAAIELRAGVDGQRLRIDVLDRGPGIPPAELEQIFEAFVQSTATKDGSGGTGLGLAIARRLVVAHGGELCAANRDGGGAVFSVWLPATRFGDTTPAAL